MYIHIYIHIYINIYTSRKQNKVKYTRLPPGTK